MNGSITTKVTFSWFPRSRLAREVAKLMSKSVILKELNELSKPPDVLAYLRQYLDTAGFPQVFAGLPRPIVERLNADLNKVLVDPAIVQRFTQLGFDAAGGTPAAFAASYFSSASGLRM